MNSASVVNVVDGLFSGGDGLHEKFLAAWDAHRADLVLDASELERQAMATNSAGAGLEEQVELLARMASTTARNLFNQDNQLLSTAISLCLVTQAFLVRPSREKLGALRRMVRHSVVLERHMATAVLVAMREDEAGRGVLEQLMVEWLEANRKQGEREHAESARRVRTWGEGFAPQHHRPKAFQSVVPSIVLAEVNKQALMASVSGAWDLGFVEEVLHFAGAFSRFERWTSLLAGAPPVFGDEGRWTGSYVGLLLLKGASEHLRQWTETEKGSPADSWSPEACVRSVLSRTDASVLLRNWAVVNFRELVALLDRWGATLDERTQRHRSVLERLLDSVPPQIRELRSASRRDDYPGWFPWYECALSAHWSIETTSPSPLTEQTLSFYKDVIRWESPLSQAFRMPENGVPFGVSGLTVSTLDKYLGGALSRAPNPARKWQALWADTFELRELVEFGRLDENDDSDWSARADASRLVEFVLRLGLCMAEAQIHSQSRGGQAVTEDSVSLLRSLQCSVHEMIAIEVLRFHVWPQALRYVLTLCAHTESLAGLSDNLRASFRAELEEIIQQLSVDAPELLFALYVAARSGVLEEALAERLSAAGVDLATCIENAESLSSLDTRRYQLPTEVREVSQGLLRRMELVRKKAAS